MNPEEDDSDDDVKCEFWSYVLKYVWKFTNDNNTVIFGEGGDLGFLHEKGTTVEPLITDTLINEHLQ
jgi:hypothetical protein